MNKANRDKAAIADAIMSHDRHGLPDGEYLNSREYLENMTNATRAANIERAQDAMTAAEYRKFCDRIDAQSNIARAQFEDEMSAEEYRRKHGKTANDFLRNLDSSNVDTETPAKVEFREWLHYVSPAPVVDEYVFLPDRKFRADWAIPSLGIIFEYDGRTHHGTVAGSERDAEKSNLAQLAGWLFIRVNAASLKDGSGYVAAENAIMQRSKGRRR